MIQVLSKVLDKHYLTAAMTAGLFELSDSNTYKDRPDFPARLASSLGATFELQSIDPDNITVLPVGR